MPQPTYYWEDFEPGAIMETRRDPITKAEILEFAQEFDPQPFHLDEEAGKASLLGGLCASGWHICSIMMRMMCDLYVLESASLGSPGIKEVRWSKPLFAGDTLTARCTCLESRPSASRPEMGLTRFLWEGFNQKGETVTTINAWSMIRRRYHSPVANEAV